MYFNCSSVNVFQWQIHVCISMADPCLYFNGRSMYVFQWQIHVCISIADPCMYFNGDPCMYFNGRFMYVFQWQIHEGFFLIADPWKCFSLGNISVADPWKSFSRRSKYVFQWQIHEGFCSSQFYGLKKCAFKPGHGGLVLGARLESGRSRYEPGLRWVFFGVESYQWLKLWHSSGSPARRLVL